MAVKQNGVLATFTPTVSKYTNQVLASPGTATPNGYNIYTCPAATLMSGKLYVSNNTGGSLDIDVGIDIDIPIDMEIGIDTNIDVYIHIDRNK